MASIEVTECFSSAMLPKVISEGVSQTTFDKRGPSDSHDFLEDLPHPLPDTGTCSWDSGCSPRMASGRQWH